MVEFHQPQMTTHRFNMAIWALLGMAMGAMPLLAVTIPVVNPSFESNSTLIYEQDFAGGNTPLVGTSSTTGGGSWEGANIINLDGNSTGLDGAISLPFTPQSGFVYELTATIDLTGAPGTWLGVGFLESNSLYGFLPPAATVSTPTALRTGDWQVWPQAVNADVLASNEVVIRLDTTGAQWTTSMYQGGDQIGSTYTYTSGNPTINYVGFVSTGDAVRNVSAFQLKSAMLNANGNTPRWTISGTNTYLVRNGVGSIRFGEFPWNTPPGLPPGGVSGSQALFFEPYADGSPYAYQNTGVKFTPGTYTLTVDVGMATGFADLGEDASAEFQLLAYDGTTYHDDLGVAATVVSSAEILATYGSLARYIYTLNLDGSESFMGHEIVILLKAHKNTSTWQNISYDNVRLDFAASSRATERKEFMIMPWNMMDPNNPALGYFNDPAQFEIMKDCGFNTAPLMVPSLLASCQQAGLKGWLIYPGLQTLLDNYLFYGVVPTDPQIEEAVEAMVNTYDDNPAVFGYFVWDEPGGSWFPKIAKVVAEIRKRSTKPWYVNLLPTYASAMTQLQSESYDAYVTNFITTVKPQFLSYDHYALMADGTMRTGYWENMNRFYSIARQRDLPVIPIIQSVGHSILQSVNGVDTLVPYYRITSEADLRFQVFTHLAYGAKGMQYFTYFTPVLDGSYQGGPIDPSGNKTAAWNAMQNVNRRLKILGSALLGLKWEKSYHFGNLPAEYGVSGHDTTSLVQDVRNPDRSTPEVLVGELKAASGLDYLMVVNKSLTNTITPNITFKTTPQTVLEYGRTGGTLEAWGGQSRSLAPGEGMLLLVNSGADWNLADADDDGLSNLLEYGLNSDPYSADSRAGLAPALDGGSLKVTFNRINDPRLIYSLQASDDLVSWQTIWSSTGEQNIKGPVTVTDNGGTEKTKRFSRMTIASP
jgi:hypothetical protein